MLIQKFKKKNFRVLHPGYEIELKICIYGFSTSLSMPPALPQGVKYKVSCAKDSRSK